MRRTTSSTPIDSVKHADKRVNIPTEQLREFVAEDERAPKSTLYPRDPSLDPQLVWNSTRSRPFEPPETGKVAVKAINHYGDEVLKVFEA